MGSYPMFTKSQHVVWQGSAEQEKQQVWVSNTFHTIAFLASDYDDATSLQPKEPGANN